MRAVLRPAALGLQEGEIGVRLGMARTTVHHHVKGIYGRLGVRCRAHATGHALRLGVVTAEELVAAAEAATAAYVG